MKQDGLEGPKEPMSLSINARLLEQARRKEIDLSDTLEQALLEKLRSPSAAEWLEENREAISEYSDHVSRSGVFSDGLRRF